MKRPTEMDRVNYYDQRCGNRGDIDITDSSSLATTDDTFFQFTSSDNSRNLSIITAPNETSLEGPNDPIIRTPHMHDDLDKSKTKSYQLFKSSHFSMSLADSKSSLLSSILPDHESVMHIANSKEDYLSKNSSLEFFKSCDSLSATCDLSLDVPGKQYTSDEHYYGKTFQQSLSENLNHPTYCRNLSESLSSSSIYLIISQSDNNNNNNNNNKWQFHSKHSHPVVVEPIPMAARRTQNRDSIITNSVNNGYYSLKKRAPGLVINVNGGGSSYSLNLQNGFTKK